MAGSACRPFTHEEVPLMMRGFENNRFEYRNKSLLALGINTGFRISELLSLRVQDMYHFGKVQDALRIPKRLMKGNQPRHPKRIFPESKKYLKHWYKQLRDDYKATRKSYVFVSNKGGPLRKESVWRLFNDTAERVGINPAGIGTHSMRKTFANAVYDYWVERAQQGARVEPMRMVQLELGHSNIEDTYRYMAFKMEDKPDDVFKDYNLMLE